MKNKVINALSYFSVTFAPFIFPFIVWLVSQNEPDIHKNAKKAFLLHLVPIILTIILFIVIGTTGIVLQNANTTGFIFIILVAIVALIDLIIYIYNIYLGIKILITD
ncbi:DUF4870 domain-containing protein [Lentilactobacillus laojiaonis]|uniref:DUF4870 domain-containing protein n=1 Tax=Lentilactobacillus laojiaonis TaxID=2883998 RepID=UPI001D0BC500|nr:DUF4870 domain-containing protein [Lentilactobacillus laojiaonis]UDM32531.1 DUF4870 domain-containing protein [Lentilactobacillus laojiaonis]